MREMISKKITCSQLGAGVEIIEEDFDLAAREDKLAFENARERLLTCFGFGFLPSAEIRLRIGSMGSAVESLVYGYLEGKSYFVDDEVALLMRYVPYER